MKEFINKIRSYLQRRKSKKHTDYEFINWLKFVNPGMLDSGNLYCFEYAVNNLPSGDPVLEIGSFCGLSTNLISFYLQKSGRQNKFITCDKWIFEGAENPEDYLKGSLIQHKDYKTFVRDTYIRNVSFFSKNSLPYTIEVFSDEFFERWSNNENAMDIFNRPVQLGGKLSFVYIDGNHTYEFAKRDFENADRCLVKGGFILFDDSSDFSNWEVKKVIELVKKTGSYEVVAKNPNYLFRKIQ